MNDGLPEAGAPRADILSALASFREHDPKVDGRAFAFIYDAGEDARSLARLPVASCVGINGLDPTVYPSARHLENAVVGMVRSVLRAPPGAVGTTTAGGTESVMLAVKAARDPARPPRPHVTRPQVLLPETGHACFHKAGHYLGVEIVPVGVDGTMRA